MEFFYLCPKLWWRLAGVSFYGPSTTRRAGRQDQVILLVWPYELVAIGYTTTHLSACQPEGIHTFRSHSHKPLTINYLSHLLSSSQSNSKTVPPKVILALDNSLAIFAVKQRCQVTVFRLQEIVHQRRVSNVCQLYQCLQTIYSQKLPKL